MKAGALQVLTIMSTGVIPAPSKQRKNSAKEQSSLGGTKYSGGTHPKTRRTSRGRNEVFRQVGQRKNRSGRGGALKERGGRCGELQSEMGQKGEMNKKGRIVRGSVSSERRKSGQPVRGR